jgi:hypothetical protein
MLVGHGNVAFLRLYMFVQGLWPFYLVVLLLDNSRQAKKVLISVLGTLVVLALLWLPGLVTAGKYGADIIRQEESATEVVGSSISLSVLYHTGSLSYLTLLVFAFSSVVILGMILTNKKRQLTLWVAFIALAGVTLWASYAAAVVAFLVGVVIVFIVGMLMKLVPSKSFFAFIIIVAVILSLMLLILPQGKRTI